MHNKERNPYVNSADQSRNSNSPQVRPVRLLQQRATLMVAPPLGDFKFQPFRLPKLPLSLARWTNAFGYALRQRRGACVALTLLLDCEQRQWVIPAVPTQDCGR